MNNKKTQETPIRAQKGDNSMTIKKEKKDTDSLKELVAFTEHDYEEQHKYIETLKQKGDLGFSLVATEAFVEGMRDSGYRSTAHSIREFIDNSIQAGARRIDILYALDGKTISDIAIIDDGHGMEQDMIRASVLWGGTHRANDRKGFGRFGFGLPSAAVSTSKRYSVYSRTNGSGWYQVTIDLSEICAGKHTNDKGVVVAPPSVESELPKFVAEYISDRKLQHGTVIHLINPDRLTSGFVRKESFHKKMMRDIGLTYRYTLRSCPIYLNGEKIIPVDPLFIDPNALFYDIGNDVFAEEREKLNFETKTSNGSGSGYIRLRFSFMPPDFTRNSDGTINKERSNIMRDNNAYFIVTRAGRQIDLVRIADFPKAGFNKALQNNDRFWAIELDFDPTLDEDFGITVNKQQVTISERMWAILQDQSVGAMAKSLWESINKAFQERKAKNIADLPKDSESVMNEAEKFTRKTVKPAQEKEKQAQEKIYKEAKKKSKETGRTEEEHVKEITQEILERPYKVMFTSREGAPFFRMELFGSQRRLNINTAHKFYTKLYAAPDSTPRVKSALELLLFVLGSCEVESVGDKELFYQTERTEWSSRLNVTLELLNKRDPVEDAEAASESITEVDETVTRA